MQAVMKQTYAVQAVVFWSIENAYCQVWCTQQQHKSAPTALCIYIVSSCVVLQAWRNAMPIAEPYKEFADRWGSDGFQQYCKVLERQADATLQQASKVY